MDIRKVRRTARLTQVQLSQLARISRMRLSFAECGYVELSEDERERVRKVLLAEPQRFTSAVEDAAAAL
jgi:transcriptional regulator with XRE-family HTH domain